MKWWTDEWLLDERLSLCAPATRGIWADLCSHMHKRATGELKGTPEQLARIGRCTPDEMASALADLRATETAVIGEESPGLFTVVSRRLTREAKVRNGAKERQEKKRHKNVTATKKKPTGRITEQKSEIRDQTTEERSKPRALPEPTLRVSAGGLSKKWPDRTGVLMPDGGTLMEVARLLEQYSSLARNPIGEVEDAALVAFASLNASWSVPQPLTPQLFIRKWEEIQAIMSGKVRPKAAHRPNQLPMAQLNYGDPK